jgi:TP901 family phage tail tape measure protein
MAEKTAVVRLRAVVDQYLTAMGKAEKATKGLTDGERFKKLGGQMQSVGGTLTRYVSLPLLAAGVAAGKMSVDFNRIFSQMEGLAGVAADEVDGLKKAVHGLAGETGRGPQELAEGLYFVRSAGIAGKAAIEALEVSARGAAAGLGTTAAIADAVTSALGAYGQANITAAQAGDVLAATAREGKAEAAALAPQFGRLLPISSELGVRFDEVGAALAFLSRSGGGAELAATNLQNVLSKLLNPSEEGKKALEDMGMSVQNLRASIKEKGLLSTLLMLRKSLEANGMEFGDFSRDAQFTVGALALTRNGGEEARKVFDSLADSTGSLGEAFDAASKEDGFKMQQSMAQIQSAAIQLGDIIVPVAASIAGALAGVASAFAALPDPAQKALLVIGGIALVAGPLLSIGGKIVANWQRMGDVAGMLGGKLGIGARGMGRISRATRIAAGAGTSLLAALVGLEMFANNRASGVGDELEAMFPDLDTGNLASVTQALQGYRRELDELDNREGKGKLFTVPVIDADIFATNGDADRQERIDQLREKIGTLEQQERELTDAQLASAGSSREQAEALGLNADAAADATTELQGYIDALAGLFDPIFGMQDAIAGEAEAREALNTAIAEHGVASAEAAEAEGDLLQAIVNTDSAALALKASMEAGGGSVEAAAAQLDEWVASGRLTQEQADRIATSIGIAASTAEGYAGTYTATLEVDDNASATIAAVLAGVNALRTRVVTSFSVFGGGGGGTPPKPPKARGGMVRAGGLYRVNEYGEELFSPGTDGIIHPSGSGMGGGTIQIGDVYVTSAPGADGRQQGEDVMHTIRKRIREEGGDVQQVLGGRR